jgi:activator of HSP90 ATPase
MKNKILKYFLGLLLISISYEKFGQDTLYLTIQGSSEIKNYSVSKYDRNFSIAVNKKSEKIISKNIIEYQIYDVYGNNLINKKSKEINVDDLPKGLYYMNILKNSSSWITLTLNVK